MSKLGRILILSVIGLLLASCASETTTTEHKVNKDAFGKELPFSVGKDADGNPMMKSDKRSRYENKNSNIESNRDFSGNDYTKKSYRKDRWGGDSHFGKKTYAGNTSADRYKKEPWYVRKQASSANKQATASNKNYSVNPFRRSGRASEQGGRRMTTTQDARTSNSRQSYKQPEITHWKEQNGLSVKDTNSMLGR